jgi:hypothetical protein
MQTETLTHYRNRDGDRAVVLTVVDGTDRPYALSDQPDHDAWAGTHFLLDCYTTPEAAREAAEAHAAACVKHATYEVWPRYVAAGL